MTPETLVQRLEMIRRATSEVIMSPTEFLDLRPTRMIDDLIREIEREAAASDLGDYEHATSGFETSRILAHPLHQHSDDDWNG